MKFVLIYGPMEPGVGAITKHYKKQLLQLNNRISRKRPFTGKGLRPLKLLNTKPHVTKTNIKTLVTLVWEILEHTEYRSGIALSNYQLFRSMYNKLSSVEFQELDDVRNYFYDITTFMIIFL